MIVPRLEQARCFGCLVRKIAGKIKRLYPYETVNQTDMVKSQRHWVVFPEKSDSRSVVFGGIYPIGGFFDLDSGGEPTSKSHLAGGSRTFL